MDPDAFPSARNEREQTMAHLPIHGGDPAGDTVAPPRCADVAVESDPSRDLARDGLARTGFVRGRGAAA
jgi:hypothetical protein